MILTNCDFKGLEKEASSGWGPPTDHFLDTQVGSSISNASDRLEEFYTVELLDLVAKAYDADLKAFNYTSTYHSLRQAFSRRGDRENREETTNLQR